MHAKDRLHGKALKEAVLDHLPCAAPAFFSGLKEQVDRAIEMAVLGQMLRGRQEHGGVAIVPTSVHLTGVLTRVSEGVALLHGQGVHVGPESNGFATGARFDHAHNTRGA